MIVLSVCKEKLSEEEFVRPVVEVLGRHADKYYADKCVDIKVLNIYDKKFMRFIFSSSEKLIICGTALKDFEYLNLDFSWIRRFKHVLGICAGYQIIAKIFSVNLERVKKIGVYKVKCVKENPLIKGDFRAYFLHKLAVLNEHPKIDVLAVQNDEIAAFKVKDREYYALSFHPEVMNQEIFEKFLML